MAAKREQSEEPAQGDLVIERVFDAPRELVWKTWTEADGVKRWWGPKDFTAPSVKMDLRVGGIYLYCMRAPDGKDYWSTGTFRDIVPLERIVATDSFADKDGNIVAATYYGMSADIPLELVLSVTFQDIGAKTKLILRHAGMPPGTDRELARQGWNESLDKLSGVLTEGNH